MELWMLFVFLVILLTCGAFAAYIFIKETRRKRDHEVFFSQNDSSLTGYTIGGEDAEAYDATKRRIYGQFGDKSIPFEPIVTEESSSEDEDEDEGDREVPVPWQRLLPKEAKNQLKLRLVNRAMKCIPVSHFVNENYMAKAKFYRRQMLASQHWKQIQEARYDVDAEVTFIRREAEAIQEFYGAKDLVFRDAGHLIYLQQLKQEKDAALQKQEREKRAEIARQDKLALKMSKALINEVNEDEKKTQQKAKVTKQN